MPTSLRDFESVFPSLVSDLTAHCTKHNLPQNALDWFQKSLKYNTLGGKCNRGLSVIDTIARLKSDPAINHPTHPDFKPAAILGWLIELLQAFFLVSDDIMDASHTRRGQPCWYLHPNVGMIAINDAFMLESSIFVLLRGRFRNHKEYLGMLELFQDVTFRTELGQQCDLLTAEEGGGASAHQGAAATPSAVIPGQETSEGQKALKPPNAADLDSFSMDKYRFIVRYKTAYYSFYLPVALALHYACVATPDNLKQAEDVLIPMGEYFQVQDDYLDCFADPEVLGKVGTDIADNKCSWLVCKALEKISSSQRKVLGENYGRGGIGEAVDEKSRAKAKECEGKVKDLYRELELEKEFKTYEGRTVSEISEMIDKVDESQGLKREVFRDFLGKIYGRIK